METLCPRTETYFDTEAMLGKIVAHHLRTHGGGIDDGLESYADAMSEAKVLYWQAVESWDSSRSSFRTWVWNCVARGLIERKRRAMTKKRLPPERSELPDVAEPFRFRVKELLADAGGDAGTIIRLVLECPGEMLSVRAPRRSRRRLVSLLLEIGWTAERIVESFREIAELIN